MKAVLQSVVSVIGGEAAVRVANFAAVLVIARQYGRRALGAYALSLAVVTVVVMFADNGLQTAAITQISSFNAHRNQIFGRLTASKSILLAMAAILLAVVAGLTKQEALFLTIGFWVTVRAILQSYSQLQMAILKSVSKANWIGAIQGVHSAILVAGLWLAHEAWLDHFQPALLVGNLSACRAAARDCCAISKWNLAKLAGSA